MIFPAAGILSPVVRRICGWFGRWRNKAAGCGSHALPGPASLASLQWKIGAHCSQCGICSKACSLLREYGTPKSIVDGYDLASPAAQGLAYQCSLCGLCTAVCPEKLDPCRLFLEIRRRCVEDGNFRAFPYRTILGYEFLGNSSLFSWYGLADGCDTVFFPGCTLPGSRPAATKWLFHQLRRGIPGIGIVFACCASPSHDLGRTASFHRAFDRIHERLLWSGVRAVVTACPNCTKIFRQYGQGLTVHTVYEYLAGKTATSRPVAAAAITIHDPCALRDDLASQQGVRRILTDLGYSVEEREHSGERTLCCGEGGSVAAVSPRRAREWADLCCDEASGKRIVTYCAGCAGRLGRDRSVTHLADLLAFPDAAGKGVAKVARAPSTYWNRLVLIRRLQGRLLAHLVRPQGNTRCPQERGLGKYR
ncbi:MAG: (Fe-S)-binding protein [Desulforhopalus sp.]|nr:(Fe-S)-binding protein [Desulforhopalus sp.]